MTERRDRTKRLGRLVAFLLDRARPTTRDEFAEVLPDYEGRPAGTCSKRTSPPCAGPGS